MEKDELHDGVYGEEELMQMNKTKYDKSATGGPDKALMSDLNYLRFKEFLVKIGLLTEPQSN